MRIHRVSVALCLLQAVLGPRSYGQQKPANSCDIPVVITRYDNSLVEGLGPRDIQVQVGTAQGAVESVSVENGAKRIALIIDASKNIPDEEWKLETRMAAELLDHARPGDSIFLVILGTDIVPGQISAAGPVKDQLTKLSSSRPQASGPDERIYDALLVAAKQLEPTEFGDVIFLFGHHEDFGSKADPDQIQELMLKKNLRFFGMSFADPLSGKLPPGFDPNKPLPPELGPKKLEKMSNATGNYFSFHSAQVLNHPGQMQIYEEFLGDLYARIAMPYRVRLTMPRNAGPEDLKITLSNLQERKVRESGMYYQHAIYPCGPGPR
jgi:hypothetical protein